MFKSVMCSVALAAINSVCAAPMYMEFGARVMRLSITGTLKEPLPERPETVDFNVDGTGFIVSPDGLVLTAAHLIPDPKLFDEDGFKIEGKLPALEIDRMSAVPPIHKLEVVSGNIPVPPYDVGLLRIKDASTPFPYLRLCDGYLKSDRETFPILGYMGGKNILTTNYGGVAAGGGETDNILIDTTINGGNSGGPIFNENRQVFGVVVAIKTIDGQRMSHATEVVPMHKAIETLGDKALPLIGVSYESDCNKALATKINNVQSIDVPVLTSVRMKQHGVDLVGQPKFSIEHYDFIKYPIDAPEGYKWIGDVSVKSEQASVNAKILGSGSSVIIKNTNDLKRISNHVNIQLDGVLESVEPKQQSELVSDIRTFPYFKSLDKYGVNVLHESYVDKIVAPTGFIFTEIVSVDYRSINNSPSNEAKLKIVENGGALELKYVLSSGSFYERWRGLLDVLITAKIIAKPTDIFDSSSQ